jgi:acetyl esterase/lipase
MKEADSTYLAAYVLGHAAGANRQTRQMAYFAAALSAFLVISAATALRPGRRGLSAVLAYPVGWAAGELPAQGIVTELALLGLLAWWGWPTTSWLSLLVSVLAIVSVVENLALIAIAFYARRIVRLAMRCAPLRPLEIPRPRDDRFGSWWRTAAQFPFHPRDMQLVKNVSYGPLPRQRLDVWRMSTTPSNAPVIFYVHGGAWTFGDKREQGRPMLHEFVRQGWVAVACNYRLAPKNAWPAQIEDVTRTLAWIKKFIGTYGGDPERVVVSGGSAGGHLAALLALSADDPTWRPKDVDGVPDWSVRGCISLYGVLEMTGDETHWHGLGRGLRILLEQRVVQRPYAEFPEIYEQMSPYHRVGLDAPPFLVVQGANDTLVDVHVARDFVERFRRVALQPIYYVELPLTQHAFDVSASPRTSATVRAAVAFATSVAAPRPVMTDELVKSYQVPPTELVVEVPSGEWLSATVAARELGPFTVLTSDNPFSGATDVEVNEDRRGELLADLVRRGVQFHNAVGRDPSGEWPGESGFALVDQSVDFARQLARTWDQFAIYDVSEDEVLVRSVGTGEVLT